MKKFLLVALTCINICAHAKDPNKRGLFVDGFIVYYDHINWVVDSANSILGNPVREDSLLSYCKHNHVDYICLYNLYPAIAGHPSLYNTTYRGYLSCFIQNAKRNYCIKQVGATGDTARFFQDVDSQFTLIQSPSYDLDYDYVHSYGYNPVLDIVEGEYDADDPRALKSEMLKFYLRIKDYNLEAASNSGAGRGGCHGEIDVLTLEEEFWNGLIHCDTCSIEHSTIFWNYHLFALQAIASIRDVNNQDTTNNPLMTEDYIGKFHKDTINDQLQADTLDYYVDRFLLTFYVGWPNGASYDYPTHFFNAINQQWQEHRMVLLGNNSKQTVIWPLLECGWKQNRWFLGNWLTDSLSQGNNYLKAESIWRNFHADSLAYGSNGSDHYGDVSLSKNDSIEGYMWFTYRDYPFPQWMFDNCRDPEAEEERLRAPQTIDRITILNNNEVEILMPDDFSEKDYLIRFYTFEGKELTSEVMHLIPGPNVLHLSFHNILTVLNLLSTDGMDSRSIVMPLRQ